MHFVELFKNFTAAERIEEKNFCAQHKTEYMRVFFKHPRTSKLYEASGCLKCDKKREVEYAIAYVRKLNQNRSIEDILTPDRESLINSDKTKYRKGRAE
jgi:hypothetical protein